MRLDNICVPSFENWLTAIRAMRNAFNSWNKSDTRAWSETIGKEDLKLMAKLVRAGSDHRKFLRMLNVTVDITAPLYFWSEFDTYKVGTIRCSCSTMHTLMKGELSVSDFSAYFDNEDWRELFDKGIKNYIEIVLNPVIRLYNETDNEKQKLDYLRLTKALLPSSFMQRATVQLNYETLLNIYNARKTHRLLEWHTFCDWIEGLPYFKEVCLSENS